MKKVLTVLLVLSACEAPPVYSTADRRQNTLLTRIEGNVVVSSASRGNVVVLLFDAQRPPPPTGSGRPVTFTVLSRQEVFGDTPDAVFGSDGGLQANTGPFTAPFAFSLVPPGRYQIRGFVDANTDFIPWYDVTSQVNFGDVGGAAIEPTTRAFRDIVVDATTPALDVPVSFTDTALVPFDRPSFQAGMLPLTVTAGGGPQTIELNLLPISQGVVHQSKPIFLAKFIDDNFDGMPDDANKDGAPDMWPKVLVRKVNQLSPDGGPGNPLLDENDLDKNGVLDTSGADYEHFNPMNMSTLPPDGKPDQVVLAAGFDPTDILPLLIDPMTGMVRPAPAPVTKLKLVIQPRAFDISNPAAPQLIKGLPSGRYAITVVQLSGQTWRLPNELMMGIADRFSLPVVATQGFYVEVP